jgi:glycosyltransferase involved in cell wall biosynthesis
MINDLLISVIVPTYNSANYLSECINSILGQSYNKLEIIIVDDGSIDNTQDLKLYDNDRVNYYYQEHQGISSALNYAINLSKGEYISFLDADDLWHPNKLEIQLDVLLNNSNIDMVFGHIKQFISPEIPEEEIENSTSMGLKMPGYSRNTLLIRKKTFLEIGLFSKEYATGEFIEWYARAQGIGLKSHLIQDILSRRRVHRNNTTRNRNQLGYDYARLLKNVIDRRRNKS